MGLNSSVLAPSETVIEPTRMAVCCLPKRCAGDAVNTLWDMARASIEARFAFVVRRDLFSGLQPPCVQAVPLVVL